MEQQAPYYLNPNVEALSKEPIGGLMGWQELAVVVQQIADGVGYNYPRLAESLCQHLGYSLRQLAAAETAAASVAAERDHWKQEARAHAARAGYCEGQCGICNGECEPPAPLSAYQLAAFGYEEPAPLAPPASAPVAPVAGVAAGEGGGVAA